jgi:hypothetical protein
MSLKSISVEAPEFESAACVNMLAAGAGRWAVRWYPEFPASLKTNVAC